MLYLKPHYLGFILSWMLLSCSGIKTLIQPEKLDNNFRSGEILHPFFKPGNTRVLEYKVISDSVIKSTYSDSTLSFGIIFPHTSLEFITNEKKMIFGSDSNTCIIRYKTMSLQKESKQNSLLSTIILPPQKNDPNYNQDKINITIYYRVMSGTIQQPLLKNEVLFYFEHKRAEKNFDSAIIKGYLKYGIDSFYIKPLYKENLLRGKNVKPMQILQGYSLVKSDSLYAFMQHAPMIKSLYTPSLKNVLYLNSKSSPADQLLMAAYFSLISRLVFTIKEEPLY